MDKSYNDEMYQYLTEIENYTVAADLVDNLKKVEQTLRDEFWEIVTKNIKDNFENAKINSQLNLSVITKYDEVTNDTKLPDWFEIFNADWEYYIVTTEKEDIGIRRKNNNMEELKLYEPNIRVIIQRDAIIDNYRNFNWPCWKTFNNYRFNNKVDYINILPSRRESKVIQCTNQITEYLNVLIKACDTINTEITNLRNFQK